MRSIFRTETARWWVICLALFAVPPAPARAQDLGIYASGDRIALPVNIGQLEGEIAIEIDAIDVTDFAEIDGDQLLVTLGPLAPGPHEVTVYLFQGADYEVIARFSFTARAGVGTEGGSISLTGTHEVEARSVNGETTLDATSSGEVSLERTGISGRVGYVASTLPAEQINGRTINITEYAFRLERPTEEGMVTAILGHQTLSFDPLVINSLNRRGLGVGYVQNDGRVLADLFALRAEDALGAENITGLSERDDRIFGVRLAYRPKPSRDLMFSVQGYRGRGTPFGALTAGEGSGWSIGIEGSARDGRLRYGLHAGETRWDEDADGPLAATSGELMSGYLEYDVLDGTGDGGQLTLRMAYDAHEFDSESLANPGLAPGDEVLALGADYSTERLWLGATLETRMTNHGGPDTLEVDRINRFQLDGTWDLLAGAVFDTRSLTFGGYLEEQDRQVTPIAAIPPEDYVAAGLNLGLDLSSEATTLNLTYTLDYTDEKSPIFFDNLYQTLGASVTRQITDDLSLTAGLTSSFTDDAVDSWWTHDATLLIDYQSGTPWRFGIEFAATETSDPFASDGRFVMLEASRPLGQAAELVLYGSYADGGYVETAANHDKVVGVILRASTDILK